MKCLIIDDLSPFTLEKLRSAHPVTICMINKNHKDSIVQKSFINNMYQVSAVKEYVYELEEEDDILLKMISENKILSGELYPYFENYKKEKSDIYGIIFLPKPIDIDIETIKYTITHLIFSQRIDSDDLTLLAIDVQYQLLNSSENNDNGEIIADLKLEQRNTFKKLLTQIMINDSIDIFRQGDDVVVDTTEYPVTSLMPRKNDLILMSEVLVEDTIIIYDSSSKKYDSDPDPKPLRDSVNIVSLYMGVSIIDKMDLKDSILIFDGYGRALLENNEYDTNIVDLVDVCEDLAIYYAPRNTVGEYELQVPNCYAKEGPSSEPSRISFTNLAYIDSNKYSIDQTNPVMIRNIMKKIKSPNPYTDTLQYIYRFQEVTDNADIVFYGGKIAYFSEDLRYYGQSILYNTEG